MPDPLPSPGWKLYECARRPSAEAAAQPFARLAPYVVTNARTPDGRHLDGQPISTATTGWFAASSSISRGVPGSRCRLRPTTTIGRVPAAAPHAATEMLALPTT